MKRQGVKRGVPDVCLPLARGGYCGWWGELKRYGDAPSDLSTEQKEWLALLSEQGYFAAWHKGWDHWWDHRASKRAAEKVKMAPGVDIEGVTSSNLVLSISHFNPHQQVFVGYSLVL